MSLFVDFKDGASKEELEMAKETIESGGVIAFPIDNMYVLGVSVFNEDGIMKLYDIKNRPHNKPISVLVSDFSMIKSLANNISEDEKKLIDSFLPGPLTIVLDKKDNIPDIISEGNNTVGIRMPSSELALKLLRGVKVPLAITSANLYGEDDPRNIEIVKTDFGNLVDCYIDAGELEESTHSTVVRIEEDNINIIREGAVSREEIDKVIMEGKE